MTDSIFSHSRAASGLPWTSHRSLETPPRPAAKSPVRSPSVEDRDVVIFAILEAPLLPGETTFAGFARKEAELRVAFAALGVMEARALQARLSRASANDRLAQLFMRLIADRRARLINFLADARRREALQAR